MNEMNDDINCQRCFYNISKKILEEIERRCWKMLKDAERCWKMLKDAGYLFVWNGHFGGQILNAGDHETQLRVVVHLLGLPLIRPSKVNKKGEEEEEEEEKVNKDNR